MKSNPEKPPFTLEEIGPDEDEPKKFIEETLADIVSYLRIASDNLKKIPLVKRNVRGASPNNPEEVSDEEIPETVTEIPINKRQMDVFDSPLLNEVDKETLRVKLQKLRQFLARIYDNNEKFANNNEESEREREQKKQALKNYIQEKIDGFIKLTEANKRNTQKLNGQKNGNNQRDSELIQKIKDNSQEKRKIIEILAIPLIYPLAIEQINNINDDMRLNTNGKTFLPNPIESVGSFTEQHKQYLNIFDKLDLKK